MPEPLLDIRPDHLQIVRDILQKHVPQYEVWAFGSRAKWTAKEYSDLDLCIVSDKPLSFSVLGAIGEDFSESDLPWKVDVVDWATTSPSFRKIIERDKVVVQRLSCGMSSECQEPTLADICSDVSYGYTESATDEPVGPKFLRITDIQGGTFDWNSVPYCPATNANVIKYRLEIGDIVVARTGNSTGENAQINQEPPSAVFASYLIRFRPDAKQVNPFFIGYQLRSDRFRQHVLAVRGGSAQPGANAKQLGAFPIRLIPRQLQDSAVEMLRSIDDKIALLRETNATLEAIAQAFFKSWFVDFDPVRAKAEGREPEGITPEIAALFPSEFENSELGEIPKGWAVQPLGDVVQIVGGGTPSTKEPGYWEPPEYHWVTPKDLSGLSSPVLLDTERKLSSLGIKKVSSGMLPEQTLLLSSRAPIGYLAIAKIQTAINQGFIAILPHVDFSAEYLLLWCRQNMESIKQKSNGSTFMEISKSAFRTIQMVVPPAEVAHAFSDIASPIYQRIAENERQANLHSSIRDTLLPRLMSGKLHIAAENLAA